MFWSFLLIVLGLVLAAVIGCFALAIVLSLGVQAFGDWASDFIDDACGDREDRS